MDYIKRDICITGGSFTCHRRRGVVLMKNRLSTTAETAFATRIDDHVPSGWRGCVILLRAGRNR